MYVFGNISMLSTQMRCYYFLDKHFLGMTQMNKINEHGRQRPVSVLGLSICITNEVADLLSAPSTLSICSL